MGRRLTTPPPLRILADSVEKRTALASLEKDITDAHRITQSAFFSSLPAEQQKKLSADLKELEDKRDGLESELEELKVKLLEVGAFWPVAPPGGGASGENKEESTSVLDALKAQAEREEEDEKRQEEAEKKGFEEVVEFLRELHGYAVEMMKMLGELRSEEDESVGVKPPPTPPDFVLGVGSGSGTTNERWERKILRGEGEEQYMDSMDIDADTDAAEGRQPSEAPSAARKRKRRKTDEGGGSASPLTAPDPNLPTQEDLNALLEKLLTLESTAHTLQNDLVSHSNDILEQVEGSLDARLSELSVSLETQQEELQERWEKEKGEVDGKIGEVRREVGEVGEQVEELGAEVGEMLLRVGEVEREVQERRREREDSLGRVLSIEQRLNEYAAMQDANSAKIKTLEIALKAYTTRPPSPPATPENTLSSSTLTLSAANLPPAQYLFQALQEPLLEAIRLSMQPLAEEVRGDVERIVEARNRELWGTVSGVLSKSKVVLEMVGKRVGEGVGGEGVKSFLQGQGQGGQR
ncbi:hypothetical protein CVT26_014724 [Gymnopilus dilepis]|uniref:Uncharacterized protein n=1 Tax=Gymnopilus dilepis TaxID=231916 RepID=A0A409VX15_9AGAR|nr:hypothetical protein CVT26_014724 [Gymnopilus dilepis]